VTTRRGAGFPGGRQLLGSRWFVGRTFAMAPLRTTQIDARPLPRPDAPATVVVHWRRRSLQQGHLDVADQHVGAGRPGQHRRRRPALAKRPPFVRDDPRPIAILGSMPGLAAAQAGRRVAATACDMAATEAIKAQSHEIGRHFARAAGRLPHHPRPSTTLLTHHLLLPPVIIIRS
jgi:hypothetical protein